MKLRLDGLWSRRSASPNLLPELRDLHRACPAMGSVAGECREGGVENNCGGKRNLCLAKHCRISWLSILEHSAANLRCRTALAAANEIGSATLMSKI
jgi:hypothetical protein